MKKLARYVLYGIGVILGVIVLTIALVLSYRAFRQHQDEQAFSIHTPNGIQEALFVPVGGIDQFVLIRGEDRGNPVVLILHGGPGLAISPLFAWFRPWEKQFTVVQWDQRGSGMTYGRYGKTTPDMTVERMVDDGIAVSEFLRQHLHKNKIIVVAHSWGSDLGLRMIARRPDIFAAYVGTGQAINGAQGAIMGYDMVKTVARKANDNEVLNALEQVGSPPYADLNAMLAERAAAAPYAPPSDQTAVYLKRSIPTAFFAPGFTIQDLVANSIGGLFSQSLKSLYDEIGAFDACKVGLHLDVPIYFFQGDRDYITPTPLAEEYLKDITAPHKELIILNGGGHMELMANPGAFLEKLVMHVRPIAVRP